MSQLTSDQPSKSGIVTDENGERHIPSSTRADGSKRKEIRIRPGYRPPEDVEVYKNRTSEAFRTRGKGGVPGAEGARTDDKPSTTANSKNAKRRDARRKAKAASENAVDDNQEEEPQIQPSEESADPSEMGGGEVTPTQTAVEDAEAEKEKKARKLRKKLREARELQQKRENGEGLLPEQLQKAIKINELVRELEQLGLGAENET